MKQKRILLICRPLLGQIIPALGIAKELVRHGIALHFATHSSFASVIKREGVEFISSRVSKVSFKDKWIFSNLAEEIQYELRDTDATYQDILSYFHKTKYDGFVIDSTMPGPAYAAEKLGVPWISVGFSAHVHNEEIYGDTQSYQMIQSFMLRSLNHVRKTYGLPALTNRIQAKPEYFGLSPYLHLVTSLRELEKDLSVFPSSTVFVGPTERQRETPVSDLQGLTDFMSKADPRPIVLVSTPSEDKPFFRKNTERYVDTVWQCFDQQPYRVVITCSPDIDIQNKVKSSPNIRVWATAASVHGGMFSQVDYLIFHGGNGTFHRALKHAIPMIIIPNGFDAYAVANRCVQNGLGIMVDPKDLARDSLMKAIDCLKQDTTYKARCVSYSEILKNTNGNRAATDQILKFLDHS